MLKAIVLAAGKGTRMKQLTKEKPKALVEFNGKPLLEWVLESLDKAGIQKAGIVIGNFGEKIIERIGPRFGKMKISYLVQSNSNGTAKAVESTKEYCNGESFLCMNADVIVGTALLKQLMKKTGFSSVLAVKRVKNYERFGVVRVEGKLVKEIIEKPLHSVESELINIGVYKFTPTIFEAIAQTKKSPRNEFELTDSIMLQINNGEKVGFIEWNGEWKDIGTIEDIENGQPYYG